MQLAELFRRGAVVPLDVQAREELDHGDVSPRISVAHVKIPGNDLFYRFWGLNICVRLNHQYGLWIDDYEDERLDVEEVVPAFKQSLEAVLKSREQLDDDVAELCEHLLELASQAVSSKMPMFLVF